MGSRRWRRRDVARWAYPGELHAVVPRPSRRGVYDVWHMFRVTRRLLSEGTVWNSHLKTAAQSMQSCAPLTPLFVVGASLLHTCVWSQFVPVTIGFAITKLLQGGGAILGKPLRLMCMNMVSGGSSLLMCAAPVLCGRHLWSEARRMLVGSFNGMCEASAVSCN